METAVKFSTKITNILLLPFNGINPFFGVLWLSIISSVIILFVYKWVSLPSLIRKAKNRIKANILAIRIYKDQWKVIILSFFSSIFNVGKYFLLNLMPLMVLLPVLFLLFVQMEWRYGIRPLRPDEETTAKVKYAEDDNISLVPSNFYKEETVVRIPALNEVDYKVKILGKGRGKLLFKGDNSNFSKEVISGLKGDVMVPVRFSFPGVSMLLYPWEPPIGSPAIKWVKIKYPSTLINFLGIKMHWIIWYLILVVILVLPVHKKFGIEF